jgi:hypothetical protein
MRKCVYLRAMKHGSKNHSRDRNEDNDKKPMSDNIECLKKSSIMKQTPTYKESEVPHPPQDVP